ncbi:MAG: DMT family transporter, partial [Planctomycetes bacterium]|nr:DMT family transporter [Planctomycetota bacterium]
ALWSSSFILMKKASPCFGPISVGALRVIGGALVLLVLGLAVRQRWRPDARTWGPVVIIVVIGYAWPYCVQPYLIARHGSGFIGMMVGLVPLLTVVVSVPLLHVWPSRWQMVGVLGGLACLAVILGDGFNRSVPLAHLALAVTVPMGYAIANTLIKRCFPQTPSLALTTWCLGLSALVLMPIAASQEHVDLDNGIAAASTAVAILGGLGTGLCGYAFYVLIQQRGPLFAGMVAYVIPVGAVVLGWLDHERVTVWQLAALAGIIVMVGLVQMPAGRHARVEPTDSG